jgi:glucokinase
MRYVVGVDIGGTNVVVGTVAEDGTQVLGIRSVPTQPEEGPHAVIGRIARLV